jgi:hypothetical protein
MVPNVQGGRSGAQLHRLSLKSAVMTMYDVLSGGTHTSITYAVRTLSCQLIYVWSQVEDEPSINQLKKHKKSRHGLTPTTFGLNSAIKP